MERRNLSWNVSSKTVTVNMDYVPSGGDKKVVLVKDVNLKIS